MSSKSFKIRGSDGQTIEIKKGDYYFNTKARARRMMHNHLSPEGRRAFACLELATMGFQQELAVIMERVRLPSGELGGKKRPLRPSDISKQTGLSKQNTRRALEELERAGLAQRRSADEGPLRNGKVELYSWAEPRAEVVKKGSQRATTFPAWFPPSWKAFKPLISHYKIRNLPSEVTPEDLIEGEKIADDYQKAEKVVKNFLKRVCAEAENGAHTRKNRNNGKIESVPPSLDPIYKGEGSSSSAFSSADDAQSPQPKKAEDEDPPPSQKPTPVPEESAPSTALAQQPKTKLPQKAGSPLYQTFKGLYPALQFDEAKAKPAFEGKTKTEQQHILERLAVYLDCPRWKDEGGRFILWASNWLKSYDADPPAIMLKAAAATAKKGFTADVIEEAQRRFKKYGRV